MAEPLKNTLNRQYVLNLANSTRKVWPEFNSKAFIKSVFDSTWKQRELKERLTQICHCLHKHLPEEYLKALSILLEVAPGFGNYQALYFPEFVSTYGMDQKYRTQSLSALKKLTVYSSSELAIRPFILEDCQATMKWMLKMASDKNYHVRRLASEGCRPRLPWAMALPQFKKDPQLILPILEKLKDDPELYVRRSVANNINDICKDNPEIMLKTLRKWKKESPSKELLWVINHGLRSLIKQGNPKALALIGFKKDSSIKISNPKLDKKNIKLGETLSFTFFVTNQSKTKKNIMIDYIVHHNKKNGEQTPKVFKLKKIILAPGDKIKVTKKHKIQKISTRQYYSGNHFIQLQINGEKLTKVKFHLKT